GGGCIVRPLSRGPLLRSGHATAQPAEPPGLHDHRPGFGDEPRDPAARRGVERPRGLGRRRRARGASRSGARPRLDAGADRAPGAHPEGGTVMHSLAVSLTGTAQLLAAIPLDTATT